jgi:hypothetical protein
MNTEIKITDDLTVHYDSAGNIGLDMHKVVVWFTPDQLRTVLKRLWEGDIKVEPSIFLGDEP